MTEHAKDIGIGMGGLVATISLSQINTLIAFLTGISSLALVAWRWRRELRESNRNKKE